MSRLGLGTGDEVDDHLLQVIGGTELRRPDIGLDLPASEARHGPIASPHLAAVLPASWSGTGLVIDLNHYRVLVPVAATCSYPSAT